MMRLISILNSSDFHLQVVQTWGAGQLEITTPTGISLTEIGISKEKLKMIRDQPHASALRWRLVNAGGAFTITKNV